MTYLRKILPRTVHVSSDPPISSRLRTRKALTTIILGLSFVALWVSMIMFKPESFIGLASLIEKPQMLKNHPKKSLHFSYDKAVLLNKEKAKRGLKKEMDKVEHYDCFTGEYFIPPDFGEDKDILMWPILTCRFKRDPVTDEELSTIKRTRA